MEIRIVQPSELSQALALVDRVFMRYVAPDYSQQGIDTFHAFLSDPAAVSALTFYGAFDETGMLGVLATRGSSHIALFFVDEPSQGKGVGRALFSAARDAHSDAEMTVHSSPYAVEIYQKLGFHTLSEEQLADGIRYTPMRIIFTRGRAMLDEELLSQMTPDLAANYASALTAEDIAAFVERLSSKEDKIRYPAFLLLRARSGINGDVYPYWDTFCDKLGSENSYQRSIGAMLLAANARWDTQGLMQACLPGYLALLEDEKPITVRQTVQALQEILSARPSAANEIANALMRVDVIRLKDTMRKLVLSDILETLLIARSIHADSAADAYIFSALSGDILDDKLKKKFRALFAQTNENRGIRL